MYPETVKEPFDHDNSLPMATRAVQIEEYERLAKASRKLVPRFAWAWVSSGVGDQNAVLVVNGDNNPTFHTAFPGVEADAEMIGGFQVDAALGEIGIWSMPQSVKARGLFFSPGAIDAVGCGPPAAETMGSFGAGVAVTENRS